MRGSDPLDIFPKEEAHEEEPQEEEDPIEDFQEEPVHEAHMAQVEEIFMNDQDEYLVSLCNDFEDKPYVDVMVEVGDKNVLIFDEHSIEVEHICHRNFWKFCQEPI